MNLATARARYLSAIGVVLPALAMAACKDGAPPGAGTTDPPSTATGTATAIATATTPTPPVATAPTIPPNRRTASCPSGEFCITEGAKVDAKTAAAAPFTKCELTATPADQKPGSAWAQDRVVSFSAANTTTERTKTPTACCYTWVMPCPGGRVFRDATGTPSVARTMERADWSATIGEIATARLTPEERSHLADHWTREAAFEHASIASFAQLTLDLIRAGAPPDLLAETQRATLDEIEHARVAFALANAYGGGIAIGPASLVALPGACRTLADLARTTFIDACVGESVASAKLADEARQASDPVLRELLRAMADDEERHAELAWRVVAWALRSGDPEVARAMAAAQTDVVAELVALTSGGAASGNELRATVLREVVLPCAVALLAGSDGHAKAAYAPSGRHLRA